jgi:RimJ/RimL family protein N-acetyltransferase
VKAPRFSPWSAPRAQAVGLLILHEVASEKGGAADIHLGYLLAEAAWGFGLGSESVSGFVDWCRAPPGVRSIAGCVAHDNVASIRILERNGFLPDSEGGTASEAETVYRLPMRPSSA